MKRFIVLFKTNILFNVVYLIVLYISLNIHVHVLFIEQVFYRVVIIKHHTW